MMKTFSIGGVHPDGHKISRDCPIEQLPLPQTVFISMSQHLGAPAVPVVAVGDKVLAGQVIGEPAPKALSAYVHSSVSGTVKSVGPRKDLSGRPVTHVEIAVEGDEWAEGIDLSGELVKDIPEDKAFILDRIRNCGVVGLGGATFPCNVKLNVPQGSKAEMLILNGAECEPFLTSDNRIMIEHGLEVVIGAALMQKVLDGCPCTIGIEENKPEAVSAMKEAVKELGFSNIHIQVLKKKYPQGGEKKLINAVMGREVKSGALPISAGAVVQNVTTAFAVYEAVQKNKPLVSNVLTVTGDCLPVEKQHNYMFRIGMPLSFIAEYAGGVPEKAVKIVSGGPMMGKAVSDLDAATVKGSSSILYLSEAFTRRKEESNCIRCGKCANACPMGLEPFLLNKLAVRGMMDELEANAVTDCIACGCCQYTCPANIPLLDRINAAKADVMKIIKSRPKK